MTLNEYPDRDSEDKYPSQTLKFQSQVHRNSPENVSHMARKVKLAISFNSSRNVETIFNCQQSRCHA